MDWVTWCKMFSLWKCSFISHHTKLGKAIHTIIFLTTILHEYDLSTKLNIYKIVRYNFDSYHQFTIYLRALDKF